MTESRSKREIFLKTFQADTAEEIDEQVNSFKMEEKVIAVQHTIIKHPIKANSLKFIYIAYYEKWT